MKKLLLIASVTSALAFGLSACDKEAKDAVAEKSLTVPTMALAGVYDTGYAQGAEIISVQQSTDRAALTIGKTGEVDIISLVNPATPEQLGRFAITGDSDADISSVAFHPEQDLFAVAVIPQDPFTKGRVELRNATSGELLRAVEVGYWPDSVMFSANGRWLAVANEGEPFVLNHDLKEFSSPEGSITLIDLQSGIESAVVSQIALPDMGGVAGITTDSDKRFFEREVDFNGNGKIDEEVDFDGNGTVEEVKVELGTFSGKAVKAKENKGEEINIPITAANAEQLEPEYLAFSSDSRELFVSLQENNAIIVVDVATATISRSFGLGATTHLADLDDNGIVSFTETLTAFREPDGIYLSADGKLLLTADEGDTEPKASKLKDGQVGGGGRTLSVFDAVTGQLLGDTGNQLDEAAYAAGVYPEDRSDNKGSEPETVVYLKGFDRPYAAVTLERADAIALVDLIVPSAPKVVQVLPLKEGEELEKTYAPEGLAIYISKEGKQYLLCANEKRGLISIVSL